jgi:predicted TIM-barrel fold metal-dependent hydrolase
VLIVDAQIHIWTSGTPVHIHRQVSHYTKDEALRDMDAAGVDAALLHPPSWDPNANEVAIEAARAHPERFAILGFFDVSDPARRGLVDRWRQQPGMLGLRVAMLKPGDLIDHMARPRGSRDDAGWADLGELLALAKYPNVAVKATGAPSYSSDPYPYRNIHKYLQQIFDAFGPQRMFWGTDITRMPCTWKQCVTMFTEELPWLQGNDLELVMGRALCDFIGWKLR